MVNYYRGLGRALSLKTGDLDNRRCWFNRAWTLQEISENSIIGGDTDDGPLKAVPIDGEGNFEDDVCLLRDVNCEGRMGGTGECDEGAISRRYALLVSCTWNQLQKMELPSTGNIYLYEEIMRLEEMDADWHDGFCVEKTYVRRLTVEDSKGASRRAEMCAEDDTGRTHTFKVVATHQYPIPEDSYILISDASTEMEYWIVG